LFVYVSDSARIRVRNNSSSTIGRATQERIREATSEIAEAFERNVFNVGPQSRVAEIATRVWALSRAKDPNPGHIDSAPASNTFSVGIWILTVTRSFPLNRKDNSPHSDCTDCSVDRKSRCAAWQCHRVPPLFRYHGVPHDVIIRETRNVMPHDFSIRCHGVPRVLALTEESNSVKVPPPL
jgi:hypothetical protein